MLQFIFGLVELDFFEGLANEVFAAWILEKSIWANSEYDGTPYHSHPLSLGLKLPLVFSWLSLERRR